MGFEGFGLTIHDPAPLPKAFAAGLLHAANDATSVSFQCGRERRMI
jgi:hypothetical protein